MLLKIVSALSLVATSVAAFAVTPTVTVESRSLSLDAVQGHHVAEHAPAPQVDVQSWTNAKRLVHGMPLKPPHRRSRAARSTPSGAPSAVTRGYIQVLDGDQPLGYISKDVNSTMGAYSTLTSDLNSCLMISMDLIGAALGFTNIITMNGPYTNLPFFGAIKRYETGVFGPGSAGYVLFGATTQSSPRVPPFAGLNSYNNDMNIESAIFSYNADTNIISVQWINDDSSSPVTHVVYNDGLVLLTGDQNTFANTYNTNGATTKVVTLKFIRA